MKLRLGTRASDLARTQSESVAQRLNQAGIATELTFIRTAGDRSKAATFGAIGPQGVFVREIEQALLTDTIDLAVHSFKDLPTRSPPELAVAAVPERADAADVLIVRERALDRSGGSPLPLIEHARVGTAAARRRVWLEYFRPDLRVESLRGNVPTRIRRLSDAHYDAIVLAAAGVERLRSSTGVLESLLDGLAVVRLDPELFVPAPAQGALAIQCRQDDAEVTAALRALDDTSSRIAVSTERATLALAEGGCDSAFGAYCQRAGSGFELIVMLERDGRICTSRVAGSDAAALADKAWAELAIRREDHAET